MNPLPRRVIVAATAMKKTHEKSAPVLMNLIQEAQCVLKIEIALDNRGLPQTEKASWEQGARGIIHKNRVIYLPDNAVLKSRGHEALL